MNINRTRVLIATLLLATNIICILLALTLLSTPLLIISRSLLHLTIIFLLLGFILLNLPLLQTARILRKKNPQRITIFLGIVLLKIGFLILVFSDTPLLWLSSIPLLLLGLDRILKETGNKRKELLLLAAASFGFTLIFLLIQAIPSIWYLFQQCSFFFTQTIGIITGTPLLLGPTTSGLGIILISLVFLCTCYLLTPRKTRKETIKFTGCLAGILLIWILYLFILGFIGFPSKNDAVNLHPILIVLCFIPIFVYLFRYQFRETPTERLPWKPTGKKLLKNSMVWAAAFLFFSSILFTTFLFTANPASDNRKVVFYGEHMLGTWDVPEYGKYGKDAVGMFGLWPVYLTTLGYETELLVHNKTMFLNTTQPLTQNITRYLNITDYITIVETPQITKKILQDACILVITNLNTSVPPEEQDVIWEFVRNGGSLLVLGDHTNVGGMQQPLNNLLRPVGISFRFDATLPLDEQFKWLTCTTFLHHPITASLSSPYELQWGVGASLNTSTSSFPLIIGTYALSDYGNRSAQDLAYLGDYEYNNGEQLGDVILVAGAYYGNGKVIVFGDTSSFQNSAIASSYPFLQQVFSWLAGAQTATIAALQTGLAILLLIGAIIVSRVFKNSRGSFTLVPVVLCAALLFSTALNPLLANQSALTGNLVSIDVSHGERFAQESFTDESVNGLIVNLHRNNYLPVLLTKFSQKNIMASKILFCIAPTTAFTAEQVSFLRQYMTNGGFVVLAIGYDDKAASLPLLQEFNIDIEPIPLGPVPYLEGNTTAYQNEPRFVDSWPLTFPENHTISYYNFTWTEHSYHLVIFVKHGAGGLLVISDSQYLLDKNIESIYDYWPGNILFLKYLLTEFETLQEER